MKILYLYSDLEEYDPIWKELKPTGRCREVVVNYRQTQRFVEHQGWFRKHWIPICDLHIVEE